MNRVTILEALKKLREQKNKMALSLLNYLAFLDCTYHIDKKWLIDLVDLKNIDPVLNNLQEISLIHMDKNKLNIDKFTQEILRENLSSETQDAILQILSSYFSQMRPNIVPANVNDPEVHKLIFHIISIIGHVNTRNIKESWGSTSDLTNIIHLLITIAQFYMHAEDGNLTHAEEILSEAARLQECLSPQNLEIKALVSYEQSNIYLYKATLEKTKSDNNASQELYQGAKTLFLEAIELKKAHGCDEINLGRIYQAVSCTMLTFSDYEDALKYAKFALECFEKNPSEEMEHLFSLATIHCTLGKIYSAIDDLQQAECQLTTAKNLYKSLSNPLGLADALHELGIVRYKMSQCNLVKSEKYFSKSLKIKKNYYGAKDPFTVATEKALEMVMPLMQQGFFDKPQGRTSITPAAPLDNNAQNPINMGISRRNDC